MKERNYVRDRSREVIVDMVRVIWSLQRLNGFYESQIFKSMLLIYVNGDPSDYVRNRLTKFIKDLEKHERMKANIKRHFEET